MRITDDAPAIRTTALFYSLNNTSYDSKIFLHVEFTHFRDLTSALTYQIAVYLLNEIHRLKK